MPETKRFKFDLLTMIALLAAASLVCAASSNPLAVFVVVLFVLPVSILLLAISAPKNGTSLDISSRWIIFLLGKTWLFTVGFSFLAVLVVCFFGFFMPDLGWRLQRMTQGDFRAYVVNVEVQLDGLTAADFKQKGTPIYDERGLVGECSGYSRYEQPDYIKNTMVFRHYLRLHTDRRDLSRNGVLLLYRSGGKIMITKAPKTQSINLGQP